MRKRVRDGIDEWARRTPTALALVTPGRTAATYQLLSDQLTQAGRQLRLLGIASTDRVAIVVPDGPEALTAFLAISDVATAAPINPSLLQNEFEAHLLNVRATSLVTSLEIDSPAVRAAMSLGLLVLRLRTGDGAAGAFSLERLAASSGTPASPVSNAEAGDDDIALVLTTSGTTSRPKVVPLTHASISASAICIARSLELTPADRGLVIMPLFHVHGLIGAALSSLSAGASLVCPATGFDAPRFFPLAAESAPTWYTAAPTMHQAIVSRADQHPDIVAGIRLRVVRSCSAALPSATRAALGRTFRAPVVEAYGMTEAAHQIASTPLELAGQEPGSVGVPTGTTAVILDPETARVLDAGETGEVAIRGESLTTGYENAPAANAAAFVDGWFRTGDQGRMDADGHIFLTGRLKEIINRGGEKVSPAEVDEALLAHPSIAQACTFAMPDGRLGETVAAAVVLKSGTGVSERELREFAAARMAAFKVPARVVFVDELPRTPTGKVQRIGMADRLGLAADRTPLPAAPASTPIRPASQKSAFVRRIVTAIWCEVLGLDDASEDASFFESGGDSILAAQILTRIREMLQVEVSPIALFDEPTIGGLVRNVERAAPAGAPPAKSVEATRFTTLSSSQRRLWFLDQWLPNHAANRNHSAWRVTGSFDSTAFERALQAIVMRHDVLRSAYPSVDGQPAVVVSAGCAPAVAQIDLSREPVETRDAAVHQRLVENIEQPFDLSRPPLVRGLVIRLSGEQHIVAVTLHHLVSDGWSMSIFQRELAAGYAAFHTGATPELPPLPQQFTDHAEAETLWLESSACAEQVDYWRRQLAPPLPATEVRPDRARTAIQNSTGAISARQLPAGLCGRLRDLARAERSTMFAVLTAAFQVLLGRHTRSNDVVIGAPIAGRRHLHTEAAIGPFANTVALRADLSHDPPFRDFLAQVQRTILDAQAHQDVPFEKIVDALGVDRRADRTPVFQTFFNYRNLPAPPSPFPGVLVEDYAVEIPAVVGDLALDVIDRRPASADGLRCRIDYNPDLYDAQTIENVLLHFERLLESVAAGPGRALSELSMMSADEERHIVVAPNETAVSFEFRGIHELVEAQAARTPALPAVRCEGREISYADLNARANQLARRLQRLGSGPDSRVGIALTPSIDVVTAVLAVLKTGAAYVPLDPVQPQERLASIVADADPAVIVTTTPLLDRLPVGGCPAVCLDRDHALLENEALDNLNGACHPDQLFCLMYTSGSTGLPKGAMLPHRAVCNRLMWAMGALPVGPGDCVLQAASLAFDVSITEVFEPLVAGATVIIAPAGLLDPADLVRIITDESVSVISLVPAVLEALTADPAFRRCHSLKRILCGGEALTIALAQSTLDCLDVTLSNAYGPAEACVDATWYHLTRANLSALENRNVPIGRPLANVRAYVLDPEGRPVPAGVPGEIYLGGACLALGYWRRPDLTARAFVADPFSSDAGSRLYRTGDLGRVRPDGELDFLGRVDDQVKIRGVRFEPGEIETALRQHASVADVAVVADSDNARLVAYLVVQGAVPFDDELRQHLRTRVPEAMIPASFVLLEALPRTVGSKLDRRALAGVDLSRTAPCREFAAPATATETALAAIWRGVLAIEPIGVHDNFFALGGHSLLATQVIARVHERLAVDIPLRSMFEAPTIRQLASVIDAQPIASGRSSIPKVDRAAFRRRADRQAGSA